MDTCCMKLGSFYLRLQHIMEEHSDIVNGWKDVKYRTIFGCPSEGCEERFISRNSFRDHVKAHGEKFTNAVCGLCGDHKGTINLTLRAHLVEEHDVPIRLPCPIEDCDKEFSQGPKLIRHLTQKREGHNIVKEKARELAKQVEHDIFPKEAPINEKKDHTCKCGWVPEHDHIQDLRRHKPHCSLWAHLSMEALYPYACSECDRLFTNSSDRGKHQKSCDGEGECCNICSTTPFHADNGNLTDVEIPCGYPSCDSTFVHIPERCKHIQHCHRNGPKYHCLALIDKKTGRFPTEGTTEFRICEETFGSRGDRFHHRTRVHNPYQDFACEFDNCTYMGRSKSAVRNHFKEVHAERKYNCTFEGCNSIFRTMSKQRAHMLTHSEKIFACDECDLKFLFDDRLLDHKAYHHEGQGRHLCEKCGEWFYNISSLSRHKHGKFDCLDLKRSGKSEGEATLEEMLQKIGIVYQSQYPHPRSMIRKGMPGNFRFDVRLSLEECDVYVEYDGCFHFKPCNMDSKDERNMKFVQHVQRDLEKTRLIRHRGCQLIRIDGADPDMTLLAHLEYIDAKWVTVGGQIRNMGWVYDNVVSQMKLRQIPIKTHRHSDFVVADGDIMDDPDNLFRRIRRRYPSIKPKLDLDEHDVLCLASQIKHVPHHIDSPSVITELMFCREAVTLLFLRRWNDNSDSDIDRETAESLVTMCHSIPELRVVIKPMKRKRKEEVSGWPSVKCNKISS